MSHAADRIHVLLQITRLESQLNRELAAGNLHAAKTLSLLIDIRKRKLDDGDDDE